MRPDVKREEVRFVIVFPLLPERYQLRRTSFACLAEEFIGGKFKNMGDPKNKASDHKLDDVKKIQSHDSYYMWRWVQSVNVQSHDIY